MKFRRNYFTGILAVPSPYAKIKKGFFTIILFVVTLFPPFGGTKGGCQSQNVGIGTLNPNPSALLDLYSTNKGLLIPRIGLNSVTDITTISSPDTSLLVYNTNAAITGGSGVGFYYWNGTQWMQGIGPMGTTGAQGSQGIPGIAGTNGVTGATGAPGAIGPTGNPGTDGITGATGAPGTIGPTGNPGTDGITGATGAPGAIGPTGNPGTNGVTGATGAPGAIGPTGNPGTNGVTGPTGVGLIGATGPTGPSGTSNAWELLGNAGTIDGSNFIGTTDNVPFNIRVFNEKAGRISPDVTNGALFLGYQAGNSSAGNRNTFIGYQSGFTNSTGAYNTAVGYMAMTLNDGGVWNSAFGQQALRNNSSGERNTALGMEALIYNTTGSYNTSVGTFSTYVNNSGSYNTAVGYYALYGSTAGYNTAVGYQAGDLISTGTYNTLLGYNADVQTNSFTNATAIGNGTTATASNQVALGDANVTGFKIGTGSLATSATPGNLYYDNSTGLIYRSTASGGSGWALAGNTLTGTLPSSPTEWFGTINAADLIIKTNNTERMRIQSTGNVGIGGITTPSSLLDITKTAIGTTQSDAYGLSLVNTTAATAVTPQYSPAIRWRGNGWKTQAAAASQPVDFRAFVVPLEGFSNPTGGLVFQAGSNGGAYSTLMHIINDGTYGGALAIGDFTNPEAAIEIRKNYNATVNIRAYNNSLTFGEANLAIQTMGGTPAAPTASVAGALIGSIDFRGGFGISPSGTTVARIDCYTPVNWSGTTRGGDLRFYTINTTVAGAAPERMRISGDGLIGINNTNPLGGRLNISHDYDVTGVGARPNHIYLDNPANTNLKGYIGLNLNTGAGANLEYLGIEAVEEGVHWANVVIAEQGGNVGIGTNNPSQKLSVSGSICYTGGIGACSDQRYKKDVTPLPDALKNVLKLQGVNYYWRKDEFHDKQFSADKQIGFIAQEIEKLYPEIVMTDDKGYKSVDYSRLTPVLVEAIKEQQKIIDNQQATINILQTSNVKQDARIKKMEEIIGLKSEK